MSHLNETPGKLKPTGKMQPQTDVRVVISHETIQSGLGIGQSLKQKKVVLHSVITQNGDVLPPGDFDLLLGDQLLRIKKLADKPDWIVTSSYNS